MLSFPSPSGPPGDFAAAAPEAALGRWADSVVWRGDRFAAPLQPALPTGYPALDAELPGGGWPAAGLTELLLASFGSGEWRLLAPALRLQAARRPIVCIAAPLQPYAPALQALGLPLQQFVWIAPATPTDAAWATEQALRSGSCGAVLWWGDGTPPMLRRLHLAARENDSPLIALRPHTAQVQSSPAPLRLACAAAPGERLRLWVFKRRGPAQSSPLLLDLPAVPGLFRHPVLEPADAVARPAPALAAA
jgi:protein ImuA